MHPAGWPLSGTWNPDGRARNATVAGVDAAGHDQQPEQTLSLTCPMLRSLKPKPLYVRIHANRIVVRIADNTGQEISVAAAEPFSTSRLLVGQFTQAATTLQQALQQLFAGRWVGVAPAMVIQPMEQVDGGLSEVEERILRDLAAGAGARRVRLWLGAKLTDDDVCRLAEAA
jgi:hypothetical protein